MKTKISSVAILVIMFMTNIFSVSSQNYSDFFFDRKYENNRIISSTKYELGYKGIHEKTQLVEYSYDTEGRLSKKETFQWNNRKECWIPQNKIEYSFSFLNDSYTAELYNWNIKKGEFETTLEKGCYQIDINGNIVSLSFTRTDHQGKEIVLLNWSKGITYLAM